jgi:hypothetical protein
MGAQNTPLCPVAMATGICPDDDCPYEHGIACPVCQLCHLHPYVPHEHDAQIAACGERIAQEHDVRCLSL